MYDKIYLGDNMPELAEVETVRRTLNNRILHKKIVGVKVLYNKMLDNEEEYFKKILINNEFIDILRVGKWLIFELKEHYLLSHLRMEGKYFIKNSLDEISKHEHIIISFDDNTDLRYHDTRKFGRMKIIEKKDLYETPEIKKQGYEPFSKELTPSYLLDKFKNKKNPIKTCLLDQEIISGLGNIYVDEVLYLSKINPLRKTSSINKKECERIINGAKIILEKAIEEGGTTIKSYTSSLGVIGNYQKYLKVHKREGEKCYNCGEIIKRIKIGGRSTYYCEKCQK